jgi:hypothetical protein
MVVTNMTLRHTQSRIFHGDTLQYWYKEDQLLLENVAFIRSVKIWVFPVNINFPRANRNAIKKNPIQM